MRLFLIRHEARTPNDPTFWSPLTPTGLRNALYQMAPELQTVIQPTHIYTSPLLRCIQTVAPYCAVNRRKGVLRCDYGLFERVRGPPSPLASGASGASGASDDIHEREKPFDPNTFRTQRVTDHPHYAHLHPFVDTTYISSCSPDSVAYGETAEDVGRRARAFVSHLRQVHSSAHSNDRVVLVTHRSVINALLGREDEEEFPMGGVVEVEWEEGGRWKGIASPASSDSC
jgi:broad specificity phosphatase PhoE